MTRVVIEDVGEKEVDIPCRARCGNRIVLQYGKVEKVQCCGYQYELQVGEINLFITDADKEASDD